MHCLNMNVWNKIILFQQQKEGQLGPMFLKVVWFLLPRAMGKFLINEMLKTRFLYKQYKANKLKVSAKG